MTMLALVGTVLSVGARIPLPNVDPLAAAGYLEGFPGGAARVSVLALGILPLLSVLLFCETFKLVLPGVAAQGVASPRGSRAVRVAIMAATLVLAAMQAAGINQALVQSGMAVDNGLSALATVASLVAGVAVLIAVAERIRLPDLPQAGFWLVLSLPWCVGLGTAFADLVGLTSLGVVGVPTIGLALGSVAGAIAASLLRVRPLPTGRRFGRRSLSMDLDPHLAAVSGWKPGRPCGGHRGGVRPARSRRDPGGVFASVVSRLRSHPSPRRVPVRTPDQKDLSRRRGLVRKARRPDDRGRGPGGCLRRPRAAGRASSGPSPARLRPDRARRGLLERRSGPGVGLDPSGTVEAGDPVEHALPARVDLMARSGWSATSGLPRG